MSYGRGHRPNSALCALAGTIARPGATFRTISGDPDRYRASSVAVFAAACLLSALPAVGVWLGLDSGDLGFGISAWTFARSLIGVFLQYFLIIAAIFWIGGMYGEKRKFKNVFPVLSYCLIPVAVGAAAALGMQSLDSLAFPLGGMQDADTDLSPSFALDFTGAGAVMLLQNAVAFSFIMWAFALFVKAARISYGFGTGKAVGVILLAAAASFALSVALQVVQGLFLPLA